MSRHKLGPGPGRPKGSVNKVTKDIREAIKEAFDRAGGVDYLAKVAVEQPQVFCALIGKVIPAEVNANIGGNLVITWANPSAS